MLVFKISLIIAKNYIKRNLFDILGDIWYNFGNIEGILVYSYILSLAHKMTPPGREKFDFIDLSSLKASEDKFKYLLKFAILAPSAHIY